MISQIVNSCFSLLVFMKRFFNRQPVNPGQHQIIGDPAAKHAKEIIHLPHTEQIHEEYLGQRKKD
ncbi:hypothetical protein D3C80_2158540 [compost metagenome]